MESVPWVERSRTSPASFRRASARSRSRSAQSSWARRSRKSAGTPWWKPGSSSSVASAYVKSIRQRTASAACRSDRPSTNCSTQTVANWAGNRPGRPSRGYQSAKSSSCRSPSNRSRTHVAVVPSGLLARAICAVRKGTCSPERERRDHAHPNSYIGLRNNTEHAPVDHAAAPGNTEIPDRVKLRRRTGPGPLPARVDGASKSCLVSRLLSTPWRRGGRRLNRGHPVLLVWAHGATPLDSLRHCGEVDAEFLGEGLNLGQG